MLRDADDARSDGSGHDPVRVGVLVNGAFYRDPVTLAKAAATVDQISGGRLEFSLGGAWACQEFKAYGLPFRPLQERYDRLDEALQIIKALWSSPGRPSRDVITGSRMHPASRNPGSSRTRR